MWIEEIELAENYVGGHTVIKGGNFASFDPAQVRSFKSRKSSHDETIRTKEVFDVWMDQLIKTGRIDELPVNTSLQLKAQIKQFDNPIDWLRSRHDFLPRAIPKITKQILLGNSNAETVANHILTETQKIKLQKKIKEQMVTLKKRNERDVAKIELLKSKIAERKSIIQNFEKKFSS